MHLEVTFRNLRPREEVRRRAHALFAKLERFLDPAAEATLVIRQEHGACITELTVGATTGVHKTHDEDEDLRTALDRTFHRMETTLRRAKERKSARKRAGGPRPDGFTTEDEETDAVV